MTDIKPRSTPGAAVKYTYVSGQRPLDGYTIKHGIGKGGFGEVYFGISDGGKEVALKLIRDNLHVELRGTAQCLNLKHPNLVHLYDLRTDDRGDHWLVMEYVEGDSLRTILDRHPRGVAPELAAEWFQGLAGGVQCLHNHGIVHRDLKPGNIYLEKGHIKVGDYSLCKIMDTQRGAQTQSVGTVHYMAPEISTGNYNRQVDIYAAGVVLHEMLTDGAPFDGDSAGEILMKHLTSLPDLSKVPSPFVPILDQALRKNPAHRFQTIAEMARKVAQTQASGVRGQDSTVVTRPSADDFVPVPRSPESDLPRKRSKDLFSSLLYAAILAGPGALVWSTVFTTSDVYALIRVFITTAVCSWIVLILGRVWTEPLESSGTRRLVQFGIGLLVGLMVLWLDGHPLEDWLRPSASPVQQSVQQSRGRWSRNLPGDNPRLPVLLCYLGYYGLMFGVLRWWRLTELRRPAMLSIRAVAATMIVSVLLLFLLPDTAERQAGFAALVLAAVIVQLASPWEKVVVVRKKRYRLPGV